MRKQGEGKRPLFQPAADAPAAPIQILGVLESAGLRFDCLWVSGLTDAAWPLAARPNPFIPVALQKKAGVPQASPETSAALDRRLTEEWLAAADEVVVSWPAKEEDRDLAPSPLIAHVSDGTLELPEFPRLRDLLFSRKSLVNIEDGKGPAVAPGPVRGGTRVLADQAACPFRAFARWRLAAEPLETPLAGPDASDRGKLLHARPAASTAMPATHVTAASATSRGARVSLRARCYSITVWPGDQNQGQP